MKDLGVVVSTQPQFLRLYASPARAVELFGEARMQRMIVTREWLEAGVPVALGSDAPTTPWLTPQVTLGGAVARIAFSNEQIGPEQRLTVQEALRAHTMGGAYAGFECERLHRAGQAGRPGRVERRPLQRAATAAVADPRRDDPDRRGDRLSGVK